MPVAKSYQGLEIVQPEHKKNGKSYVVVKTKSGQTIDLYNSTWLSINKILKNEDFFKEKGIEIKVFKTYENYKEALS